MRTHSLLLLALIFVMGCPLPRDRGDDDDDATDDDDVTDPGDDDDVVDDDDASGDCLNDEMEDCNGHCAPTDWYGDGKCDDGSFQHDGEDIHFDCEALDWDDGDCDAGDDDDAVDDDDATSDPCNPTAAEFDCEAAGTPLGSGSWEAQTWTTPLTSCAGGVSAGAMRTFDIDSSFDSMFLGVESSAGDAVGLAWLVSEGGNVLVDAIGSSPFSLFGGASHASEFDGDVGGVSFPQTPSTSLESGCLAVWPVVLGSASSASVLTTASTGASENLIYLDVAIVNGAGVDSGDVEPALYQAADILYYGSGEQTDIYEAWSFYTISDSSFANMSLSGAEPNSLRSSTLGANARTVNVYIIDSFDEGILGVAGGIPGPLGHQGLPTSGLIIAAGPHMGPTFDTNYFAQTVAHELGHYLGLFHTSEADGAAWDPLSDTPECSGGEILPSNCDDGTNLMFWTGGPSDVQTTLSGGQANVVNSSPIKR